jgi:glycosyltransferase involved in cell wall biosynthesis
MIVKICYFGTYRKDYSRNKIMIAALESAGFQVQQCHETLWHGIQDRVDAVEGGWKKLAFWFRITRTYLRLIWRMLKIKDFDILMVGYPGQFDVFLAKCFSIIRRKPLVWDVFMSIYLVAKERRLDQSNQFILKQIRRLEARALKLPDLLIQDTAEYVRWFQKEYDISPERFRLIPTGADDRIFRPLEQTSNKEGNAFVILYYGTYIPNHGVMKIAQAINHLKNHEDIVFECIGDGPERSTFEAYLRENNLNNVRMLDWMPQEVLLKHISDADICLGAFGDTPQSLMTIQNKIYECMAMGKPVITGASPATETTLPEGVILLCNRDNPQDIADAILTLKNQPELMQQLSQNALLYYQQHVSIDSLGKQLRNHLQAL